MRAAGGSAGRQRAADAASWAAVGLVALAGAGAVVVLAAVAAGRPEPAAWTAACLGVVLVLLLAGGWERVPAFALLALALPLPALAEVGGARLAPAVPATAVVVGAWLLRRAPEPGGWRPELLPVRSATAFVGALVLAALFADARGAAAREVVTLALLGGLLVAAVHEVAGRPGRARTLAGTLAAVAPLAGGVAALQALGVVRSPFRLAATGFHRATLGFEWPNEAAMFLAILLPFSVHAYRAARPSPGRRLLAGLALALTLVGLASTFSRGSWIAAAAAPAVLLLAGSWRPALRFWLTAALLVVAVDVASGGALSTRAAMTVRDPLVGQRLALMGTGVIMAVENPLTGVGPGGFEAALQDYGPQVAFLWDYVGSAHNTYIQVAAETGVPGLLAFLVLLLGVFRTLLRSARPRRGLSDADLRLRRTVLWAFATGCLVAMVEWCLNQGVGQLLILVVAMGLGLAAAEPEEGGPPALAPGGRADP